MSSSSGAAAGRSDVAGQHPELDALALRLFGLTAGDAPPPPNLRARLQRVVTASHLSGTVKTLVVQALLLIDDPYIADGSDRAGLLLTKTRKLLESAIAAHAVRTPPTSAGAVPQGIAEPLLAAEFESELIEDFIVEARDQLAGAESALLSLDADPTDASLLDAVFRAFHTIKGTSAFFGVEAATELAHHAESLLGHMRAGRLTCAGALSNLLFRAIDMLDAMLVSIESADAEQSAVLPGGYRALVAELRDAATADGPAKPRTPVSGTRRSRVRDESLRVRAEELDRLDETVAALVFTHAMLARDASLRSGAQSELARKLARAERLVLALRESAAELRTIAFSAAAQRLARVARDTAYRSGKQIDFDTDGEEVTIERGTAEALADPLMHMVRNAIDHGIEPMDERIGSGKPPVGTIRVRAHRDGSQLVIELSDDGRGLNADRLVQKAIERGMVAPDSQLAEHEAYALIFEPGFSTADVVTDLSGRGVGMDVVWSAVDALGGTVEIESRAGAGTTFTIRVPFRSQLVRDMETWGETSRTIGLIA